ncbi:MAG: inositol monophosphatase family protein [Cyanobacteriota bacterium]
MFNSKILSDINLSIDDINYVNSLVYEAGQLAKLRQEEGSLDIEEKEGPDDLVTKVDKELNDLIINALHSRFCDDSIISEEQDPDINYCNLNRHWVIDPIDGTNHYVKENDQYSVMVGILINKKPVAGWVYSPTWNRLFLGIPGDGVYEKINNGPIKKLSIKLNQTNPGRKIRIMMGKRNRRKAPKLVERLNNYDFIEMGSIGLKVAMILDDKADLFIHTNKKLKLWDTVAPTAIALAANLTVTTLENQPFLFCPEILEHPQTYTVGLQWAINETKYIYDKYLLEETTL